MRRKKKYFVTTLGVAPNGRIGYGYACSSLRAAFARMLRLNDGYLAGIAIRGEPFKIGYMHHIRRVPGKVWHDTRRKLEHAT